MISARPSCQGPNEEWGDSTRRHMLEPVRPEAVLPDRALYLPTASHLFIVNKLLSLSGLGSDSCDNDASFKGD
jgi:hypothetical protein